MLYSYTKECELQEGIEMLLALKISSAPFLQCKKMMLQQEQDFVTHEYECPMASAPPVFSDFSESGL